MSSANDSPDAPRALLRRKATTPAVPVPREPTPEAPAFDWALSPKDICLALKHCGRENVLRFAVQLWVQKKDGRFLSDYVRVPPVVVGYLCRQLKIQPLTALTGRARANTEGDYQCEIVTYLGWQPYDETVADRLAAWIAEQVAQHLYADNLVEKAENWLRETRIVIPGPVVFGGAAYRHAESAVFRRIAAQIPPAVRQAIDRLLTLADPGGKTDCMHFAHYLPEVKAKHMVCFLERYQTLAALGLEVVRFTGVSRPLLECLAAAVRSYDAWQIRRFEPDKRYALAARFLHEAKKTLLDYLVAMHAQFMTAMERQSRRAWEEAHGCANGWGAAGRVATMVLGLRGE